MSRQKLYVLRCGVWSSKTGRCPARFVCRHFPTGVSDVYREGWRFHYWGWDGGVFRYRKLICPLHKRKKPEFRWR